MQLVQSHAVWSVTDRPISDNKINTRQYITIRLKPKATQAYTSRHYSTLFIFICTTFVVSSYLYLVLESLNFLILHCVNPLADILLSIRIQKVDR